MKHMYVYYTLVLAQLPVHFQLKSLLIAFKARNGQTPVYITSVVCLCSAPRSLRFTGKNLLHVLRSGLKRKGDRALQLLHHVCEIGCSLTQKEYPSPLLLRLQAQNSSLFSVLSIPLISCLLFPL